MPYAEYPRRWADQPARVWTGNLPRWQIMVVAGEGKGAGCGQPIVRNIQSNGFTQGPAMGAGKARSKTDVTYLLEHQLAVTVHLLMLLLQRPR